MYRKIIFGLAGVRTAFLMSRVYREGRRHAPVRSYSASCFNFNAIRVSAIGGPRSGLDRHTPKAVATRLNYASTKYNQSRNFSSAQKPVAIVESPMPE